MAWSLLEACRPEPDFRGKATPHNPEAHGVHQDWMRTRKTCRFHLEHELGIVGMYSDRRLQRIPRTRTWRSGIPCIRLHTFRQRLLISHAQIYAAARVHSGVGRTDFTMHPALHGKTVARRSGRQCHRTHLCQRAGYLPIDWLPKAREKWGLKDTPDSSRNDGNAVSEEP